jgi:hypothetical protein
VIKVKYEECRAELERYRRGELTFDDYVEIVLERSVRHLGEPSDGLVRLVRDIVREQMRSVPAVRDTLVRLTGQDPATYRRN